MWSLLYLVVRALVRLLVSARRAGRVDGSEDLEILVLRHQLRVLQRTSGPRTLRAIDRVWTNDQSRGFRLARRIQAGTTFLNIHRRGASGVDMPSGGFKESGLGRGHGVIALEEQFELHTISSRQPA